MPEFDPTALAEWTGGCWRDGHLPEKVAGFCFDTRKLVGGDCFIALTGERDGHEFVERAALGGAVAALVERPVDSLVPQLIVRDTLLAMEAIAAAQRSEFNGPVIGVTGSCGKTSTKEMLRLLLGKVETHATAGNWNNRIGVPMTLFGLDSKSQAAVIEAGINQPQEMSHLGAMIAADLVIVTTIAPAHLELLGSLETIAVEKSLLFAKAMPSAKLILSSEAFSYPAFQAYADRAIVLAAEGETISGNPAEVVRYALEDNELKLAGVRYQISTSSEGICRNAALALIAAERLNVSTAERKERIEQWAPENDRGRIIRSAERTVYVDCYNANPSSMVDALRAFDRIAPAGQARCYVLGAMNELGRHAAALHAESVAEIVLREGDRVYLVGPAVLTDGYRTGVPQGPWAVESAEDVEIFKSVVAQFRGALFLKGSRSYALEKLIPTNLNEEPAC